MGRRFPEFCVLKAACRVSVKASSSATGEARVASYQAAINAVAAQHYADLPLVVEVLNKWLEMNQDFVRDPVGYIARDSSPSLVSATKEDHPTTISTIQNAADRPPTQSSSTSTDGVPLPISDDSGAPECVINSPPTASTTEPELNDLDDTFSSSNGRRDVPVPVQKIWPPAWIAVVRFLPFLGSLGVGNPTSGNTPSPSSSWLVTPKPPARKMPDSLETPWFRLSFLASFCQGWWTILKGSFTSGNG